MLAENPDGVAAGSEAVLEDAGVGGLRFGVWSNIQKDVPDAGRLIGAKDVVDRDAGEIVRAEHVDSPSAGRPAGNGAGTEGLVIIRIVLLANDAEGLGGAEVGLDDEGIGKGSDLCAGVEVLGEAGYARVRVRRDGGIVLVKVLEAERVLLGGVVVEVGHSQIGGKARHPGNEDVVQMGDDRRNALAAIVWDEPFAGLAGQRGRVEQDEGKRVNLGCCDGIANEGADRSAERVVAHVGNACRRTIVCETDGNVEE